MSLGGREANRQQRGGAKIDVNSRRRVQREVVIEIFDVERKLHCEDGRKGPAEDPGGLQTSS